MKIEPDTVVQWLKFWLCNPENSNATIKNLYFNEYL